MTAKEKENYSYSLNRLQDYGQGYRKIISIIIIYTYICFLPFPLSFAIFKCHKSRDRENNLRRKNYHFDLYHCTLCNITFESLNKTNVTGIRMSNMPQILQCLCLNLMPREQKKNKPSTQQPKALQNRNALWVNFQTYETNRGPIKQVVCWVLPFFLN